MLSLISLPDAQSRLAADLRARRLAADLTQEGLAVRAGVSLASLRRFERSGQISLESFLKLIQVVGDLEAVLAAVAPAAPAFDSIEQVVATPAKAKQRGRRK